MVRVCCIPPLLLRVGFLLYSIPEGQGWAGPTCVLRPAWAQGGSVPRGCVDGRSGSCLSE